MSIYTIRGEELDISLHPGQLQAWNSEARTVAVVAGSQGGKTIFVPIWLWREIQLCGPGAYGFICPTFTLMDKKALPTFKQFFQHTLKLGKYSAHDKCFNVSEYGEQQLFGSKDTWLKKWPGLETLDTPTQIFFGYARNPDSLESATYKAVVCDEAGQKDFKLDSYEALMRRLSIHRGRMLIATTPYSNGGWLRTEIFDRWKNGDKSIDFIRFASNMNPAFSQEEFEDRRAKMQAWRFRMFYEGHFERPAGLIYDCFDEQMHKCPRFTLSDRWQRYLGLDFGGVNTAGVFFAEEPTTKRLYGYREYKAGSRTSKEHATALLAGEPMVPICVGGSASEGQWRAEFRAAGLPVREPAVKEVEVGIARVYAAIKMGNVTIFNDLRGLLEEVGTYARELDDRGEPTEKIEAKDTYHLLDSCRYILGWKFKDVMAFKVGLPKPGQGSMVMDLPGGVLGPDRLPKKW